MATSRDSWTGVTRGFPYTRDDLYSVEDLVDAPDGFVMLVNRSVQFPVDAGPEETFLHVLLVSSAGRVLWRTAISAQSPGPEPIRWRTVGAAVIRSLDGEGYLVTGTIERVARPSNLDARTFVCRLDKCGFLLWFRVYTDDQGVGARAIGLVAVETPMPHYLVAAAGSVEVFGRLGPTWVHGIDDNGHVVGDGVRHFGIEVVDPLRFRKLPGFGPVLVGQTYKRDWIGKRVPILGWVLRLEGTGLPVSERWYTPRTVCDYPGGSLQFLDVAEGDSEVVVVGKQYGGTRRGGACYLYLDGLPGPEGRSGDVRFAYALENDEPFLDSLFGVSPGRGDGGRTNFAVVADGWLARLGTSGDLVWEKFYRSIGSSTWTVFLRRTLWRANGDVIAGGFFLPGTFLPIPYGAASLVCSESAVDPARPSCSEPTESRRENLEAIIADGPANHERFTVESQTWDALVEANGVVVVSCRPE